MPDRDISRNVRDTLLSDVFLEIYPIKSTYSQKDGFYLLSLPSKQLIYCFDTRMEMEDGSFRVTTWNLSLYSMFTDIQSKMYFGDNLGYVMEYSGRKDLVNYDNTGGQAYTLHIHTGWNPLAEEVQDRTKILKKFSTYVGANGLDTVLFHWAGDFNPVYSQAVVTLKKKQGVARYNISKYSIDKYGLVLEVERVKSSVSKSARVFSIGWHVEINDSSIYFQNFALQFKIGRKVV